MTGDLRAEPGYDYILQAMAGWMSLTGEPDAPPAKSGLSVVDFAAGLAAGYSLLAGLLCAARTVIDCAKEKFFTGCVGGSVAPTSPATNSTRPSRCGSPTAPSWSPRSTRRSASWPRTRSSSGCAPSASRAARCSRSRTRSPTRSSSSGLIVSTEHPVFGTVRAPGNPIRVGELPVEHRRAPRRNEDYRHVLGGILGYDDARIDAVTGTGAVGPI